MNVRTSLAALHQAALAPEHLEACLGLDQASLGGLWNRAQWQSELAEQRRPGVGLWQGQQLLAMASGWLVVDELHITVVAVDPQQRRPQQREAPSRQHRGNLGHARDALCQFGRQRMVLRQPLDVMIEGMQTHCRRDPGLAHGPAPALFQTPGLFDERC